MCGWLLIVSQTDGFPDLECGLRNDFFRLGLSACMHTRLEQVRAVARSYFEGTVSPAHDWNHVRRVETNARRLVAEIDTDETLDRSVLEYAVVLHDIGRPKEDRGEISDHAEWGASEAARILLNSHDGPRVKPLEPARVDAVVHCIRAHRFSNDVEPASLEAKLVSDADNLDALGAIGIARTFTYGGERGTPIEDPEIPVGADESPAGQTSVNHLHKKILQLPDRMYTEPGRQLATARQATVRAYLEHLEAELDPVADQ